MRTKIYESWVDKGMEEDEIKKNLEYLKKRAIRNPGRLNSMSFDDIPVEVRNKVIGLKVTGKSYTQIEKETNVSRAIIQRILRESGYLNGKRAKHHVRRFTDAEKDYMLKAFKSGATEKEIAKVLKRNVSSVISWIDLYKDEWESQAKLSPLKSNLFVKDVRISNTDALEMDMLTRLKEKYMLKLQMIQEIFEELTKGK